MTSIKVQGRRDKEDRRAAFTLVEIMMVVVIIGILAVIALVAYTNVTLRMRRNAAATEARLILASAQLYRADIGIWPAAGVIDNNSPLVTLRYMPNPNLNDTEWKADITRSDTTPGGTAFEAQENGLAGGPVNGRRMTINETGRVVDEAGRDF